LQNIRNLEKERRNGETVKREMLTVKMIAAKHNTSVAGLARMLGVSSTHLQNVAAGKTLLSARDYQLLNERAGVPFEMIAIDQRLNRTLAGGENA
jgi:transcriptional regulator with XRE-family HTH domain